jgi:serine/threonine protein kinase
MECVDSQFRTLLAGYQFVQPFVESDLSDCPCIEDASGLKLQIKLKGVDELVLISTFKFAEIKVENRDQFAKVLLRSKDTKQIVYIQVSDFSKAVCYNPAMVAVQAKAGNLGLFLKAVALKTFSNEKQWSEDISDYLEDEVIRLGSSRTNIPVMNLKSIMKWCNENHQRIVDALKKREDSKSDDPYIVYPRREVYLPHSLEIRSLFDIVVRYEPNFVKSSLSIGSRQLCLLTGRIFVKLKRCIEDTQRKTDRILYEPEFRNELEVIKRTTDLPHIVQAARKPELAKKLKKVYPRRGSQQFTHKLEWRIYLYFEDLGRMKLSVRLEKIPRLFFNDKVTIFKGIAKALEELHKVGVLHRDVKSENVMLTPTGPVVFDFDLSDFINNVQIIFKGTMTGTPPEYVYKNLAKIPTKDHEDTRIDHLKDKFVILENNVDETVDIYALGVLMFHCLTLQYPYISHNIDIMFGRYFITSTGEYRHDFLRKQQQLSDKPLLEQFKIPIDLIDLVLSMIDPLPEKRPKIQQIKEKLNKL